MLGIGGLRMRVDQQDQRCVMINVDPETTAKNPDVLRAVTRVRGACLGVYGSTVEPGRVAVGDPVFIELGAVGRRCQYSSALASSATANPAVVAVQL